MRDTGAIVLGAGQAGLAMSRCLTDRAIDHVVLERGRIAERWRSERWDSLRLLTPNWQSRLPGYAYAGEDPDGYMSMPEVIAYLERYAAISRAPVETATAVTRVAVRDGRFRVETSRGAWQARAVVVATGYCDVPAVPAFASDLSGDVQQITPTAYRNPRQLPEGGVLVVGASASGVQLADEIHRSGRPVTLAVGRHLRMPRRYRGRDVLGWLDDIGAFGDGPDTVADLAASLAQPSFQLVGRPDHASLGLAELRQIGVRLVGRVKAIDGRRLMLDPDLVAPVVAADAKLALLLDRVDRFVAEQGTTLDAETVAPLWPSFLRSEPPSTLDLGAEAIRAVVWATGFRRRYDWLDVPVLDTRGEIRHRQGLTPVSGLAVLGLPFQRRRNSAFLDGVGDDAEFLADHLAGWIGRGTRTAA